MYNIPRQKEENLGKHIFNQKNSNSKIQFFLTIQFGVSFRFCKNEQPQRQQQQQQQKHNMSLPLLKRHSDLRLWTKQPHGRQQKLAPCFFYNREIVIDSKKEIIKNINMDAHIKSFFMVSPLLENMRQFHQWALLSALSTIGRKDSKQGWNHSIDLGYH